MRTTTARHLLLSLLLTLSALLQAQNGAVDQPFGFKEMINNYEARCVRSFSNGNVLICGDQYDAAANSFRSNISMYDRYGQLLSSYTNGLAGMAYACDTLPNGQGIAIATNIDTPGQLIFMTTDSLFVDYHPRTSTISGIDVYSMKALTNGALLVCGRATVSGTSAMFVSRYHPHITGGRLTGMINDPALEERTYSFGTDAQARALDVQSDGRIIVAGHEIAPQTQGIVIRIWPDGTIDGTFNSNSGVIIQTGGDIYENYALSVDPQDNIYASGQAGGDCMTACYTPDGGLRYTRQNYGNNQAFYTSAARGGYLFVAGLDPDYNVSTNSLTGAALVRTTSAIPFDADTTFHPFSNVQNLSFSASNSIFGSCFQADGRLLVCGKFNSHAFVARLGSAATGLAEVGEPVACDLYPNPATGILHIRPAERLSAISIYTLAGQHVLDADGAAQQIDISMLADGPYLIGLSTADGRSSHRLLSKATNH